MNRLRPVVLLGWLLLILTACGQLDFAVIDPASENEISAASSPGQTAGDGATGYDAGWPGPKGRAPMPTWADQWSASSATEGNGEEDGASPTAVAPQKAGAATASAHDPSDECSVRADWPTYKVKSGDTLSKIARLSGATVNELTKANCLDDPNRLHVGQEVCVPQAIVDDRPAPSKAPPTPEAGGWTHYSDPLYQVAFDYPASWQNVSHGWMSKFLGSDGFVQLAAAGAPYDLNKVTEDQAFHRLLPYGSAPTIEKLTLSDGRPARLILPSEDQPASMNGQSMLVTQYGEPVPLGIYRYNYFMLAADQEHISAIAGTLRLPPPPSTINITSFDVAVEELAAGGKRLTFSWDSNGATRATIYSGTARRFAPWWPVEAAGTLTVELEGTILPDPVMTLRVFNDIIEQEATETFPISWPCRHGYFFSPAPEHCPRDESLVSAGALQQFERGFMIWLAQSHYAHPGIYAFSDSGQVNFFSDTWTEAEPVDDPDLVPPDGLLQPQRGFGKLWRATEWLRDQLGWATTQETAYQLTFQSEMRESIPGVSYLTLPDGSILQLVDLNWHLFRPGEDWTSDWRGDRP